MATKKVEFTDDVDGVRIPKFFSKECFQSALHLKPKPGDIFIATYPKSGTTWMQNVVLNILRRGQPLERSRDFFLASPFLDQLGAEDSQNMMIRPGAYKTHLPFNKIPWSEDAKYIYVARNPKDCCVSFYHHMKQIPVYQFSDATFDDFFELFITGQLEFNDYFEHIPSWYGQRHRPNVYFTTYEEMQKNLQAVILQVAEFLQEGEARYLQENADVLDRICHNCSFEEMKFINVALNDMYDRLEEVLRDPGIPRGRKHIAACNAVLPVMGKRQKINFIREGKVGSWKRVLTPIQSERMNEKIKVLEHCTDLMQIWKGFL